MGFNSGFKGLSTKGCSVFLFVSLNTQMHIKILLLKTGYVLEDLP